MKACKYGLLEARRLQTTGTDTPISNFLSEKPICSQLLQLRLLAMTAIFIPPNATCTMKIHFRQFTLTKIQSLLKKQHCLYSQN